MKILKLSNLFDGLGSGLLSNIKITHKLTGLLVGLLVGFVIIGLSYKQVLDTENEAIIISEKMSRFENGIHEVQVDLLNARRSESDFYLKKYPIYLGKFDARLIVASQNLKGLTNLVKDETELKVITSLGDAFELYRDSFIKAAETQIEIGLDKNTGINYELESLLNSIDGVIGDRSDTVINLSLLKIRQYQENYLLRESEDIKNNLEAEIEYFKSSIERSVFGKEQKKDLKLLINKYADNIVLVTEMIDALAKQKDNVKKSVNKIDPLFENLLAISNKIINQTNDKTATKRHEITTLFSVTLGVIAMVFSVALVMLARSIVKPMRKLQETVLMVNDGDMTARSNLNRNDEIGHLAKAFDTLLDERLATMAKAEKESERLNESVIELIKSVSVLAQKKDLTVKIPVSEDITGAISDSLNLLAKETAKILTDVKLTSNQVAEVSAVVKDQSDHVIMVANQEQKEVDETAVLLENSYVAMNEISADAQEASIQADKTIENTQRALGTVLSSVDGINSIRSTISETEKRIKRLGERSQEIAGIVNLINSIAERTHILALNASMHAASAGDAGRGFAVVADEVQRLAENAREATSEISTVVNNIRVETADTATTMNTVISLVAEGTRLAEQAGINMKEAQKTTSELVKAVQQIASSSVAQAGVSKQLMERAKLIRDSAEQTGRELIEQTKNTDTLVKYSEDLVTIVNVFKLPGETKSNINLGVNSMANNINGSLREAG